MQTITCIIKDNYESYSDPLIYRVEVENPNDEDEVMEAVKAERTKDLSPKNDLDLTLLFCFAGDHSPLVDWRS